MDERTALTEMLAPFPNVPIDKLHYAQISAKGLDFIKLCQILSENSRIVERNELQQNCIVTLPVSSHNSNQGIAALILKSEMLCIAAYAPDGLVKRHSSEKIIKRLTEIIK